MFVKELQKQINHGRYNTLWFQMHRIRATIAKQNDLYFLEGIIELDEGYFEKATKEGKRQRLKCGAEASANRA